MTDAPRRYRCAVLGASGYIGQHFVRLLAGHPTFELTTLVGSDRTHGQPLSELWQLPEEAPPRAADLRLESLGPAEIAHRGIEVVFSGLPSGNAGPIESELSRRGVDVFTNASDHRMDPDVPLLVPEVNADHLDALLRRSRGRRGAIVADPNCSAAGLVVALRPVWDLLRPRAVHVTTYQALSGAGLPGVASLSITDNVVPFIAREEEKVAQESQRMLGSISRASIEPSSTPFIVQCARVAVRDGHLEAITIDARRRPSLSSIARAFRTFDPLVGHDLPSAPHPAVILRTEPDRPQPLRDRWAGAPERARGMAVSVGRIRWEAPFLRFFALSHNAIRGGAGGSVLNAELAAERGYVGRGRAK